MFQSQGEGEGTPRKERGFYALLLMAFRMTKNCPLPHWHLDTNAGCGHNANCPGSPLVAVQAAIDARRRAPVRFCFCDIEEARMAELIEACPSPDLLPPGSDIVGMATDNANFLRIISASIRSTEARPELTTGTVLCDPNGFPVGCPVDALDTFLGTFPRMDLILNVNLSLFARVRGCLRSEREEIRKGFLDWPKLNGLVDRFHKRFPFVRNPSRGPRERFTTFFLTNNPNVGDRPFLDFFPRGSSPWHEIIENFGCVNPDQPWLFEDLQ